MSELGPTGQSVGASGARSAELGSGRPEAVLINPWMIASCAGVNWAVGSRGGGGGGGGGGEWRCRRRSPLSGTTVECEKAVASVDDTMESLKPVSQLPLSVGA